MKKFDELMQEICLRLSKDKNKPVNRFDRRKFLLGAGLSPLALSLAANRPLFAQDQATIKRLVILFVPTGMYSNNAGDFFPANTGALPNNLPFVLQPLNNQRGVMTILGNIRNETMQREFKHHPGPAGLMTGAHVRRSNQGGVPADARSIDQIVAEQIQSEGFAGRPVLYCGARNPIQVVGMEEAWDPTGLALSWRPGRIREACLDSPQRIMDQFLNPLVQGNLEEFRNELNLNKLILELNRQALNEMGNNAKGLDKFKLDGYLASSNTYTGRIDNLLSTPPNQDAINAVNNLRNQIPGATTHRLKIRLVMEMVRTAFQYDMTRVAVISLGPDGYDFTGNGEDEFRGMHNQNGHSNPGGFAAYVRRFSEEINRFATNLANTNGSDGLPLLQNTLNVVTSGMGESQRHNGNDLPVVLLGGQGLGVQLGQYRRTNQARFVGDLWLGVAQKFGVNINQIGLSTQRLDI